MAIKEKWYIILSSRTAGVSHKNTDKTEEYAYSEEELIEKLKDYEPGQVMEILKDETFYAVLHDDYQEWDDGSYNWDEAVEMAKERITDGCANVCIAAIDKPATNPFLLETCPAEDLL